MINDLLAQQLIDDCRNTKSKKLDLGYCGLTEIPKEVIELTWLEELYLCNAYWNHAQREWIHSNNIGQPNKLYALPKEISKLKNLKILFSGGDHTKHSGIFYWSIRDISILQNLTQLTTLDLSYNQITDISILQNLTQLTALYLSNNQITDISILQNLTQLTSLNLSNNQITDISILQNLTQLTALYLRENPNVKEFSILQNLTQLTALDLRKNQITDISILQNLTQLTALDLSSNLNIKDFSIIQSLTQLTVLNLSYNQITDISILQNLTQLTALDLGSNPNIKDFSILQNLTQLTALYLSNNQITDISILQNLTQLTALILSSNQITDIFILQNLTQLTALQLNNNQINDISILQNLTQLTALDLSNNPNTKDFSLLAQLPNISKLTLNNNKLSNLTMFYPLIKDKGFQIIWKEGYKTSDKEINVKDCSITTPPLEIVKQGNEAILNYLLQIDEQEGTEPLYEAKMLIVGEPGAGKTTLLEKLKNPTYIVPKDGDIKIKSTVGINILEGWSFPFVSDASINFKANLWDFGGQEIQYMIHHFFLTPQALYVLVADDRKQNTEFDYWFRIINLLGREKEEEKIKVLVVLNQIGHDSVTNFDHARYVQDFPKLDIEKREVNFAKNDLRCGDLRTVIQEALCSLPHVGDELPKLWQPIRNALFEKRKSKPHITFSEFQEICNQSYDGKSLTKKEDQLNLSRYLHKLGIILHYEENALFDFMVLNPQWAVAAVYSLIKNKNVEQNNGKFTEHELNQLWKTYTPMERRQLLELMLKDKFEICYRAPQHGIFIAPQMLPPLRPKYDWNSATTMKFRYQYPFMPKGLISRLIVRLNEDIAGTHKDIVWKDGVLIEGFGCQAQIIQEKTVKEGLEVLDIEVKGKERERKFLLRKIMEEVEKIHERSFTHIDFEKMIPCNCEFCDNTEEPTYFEYTELIQYQEERWNEIDCRKGKLKKVSVGQLLEGIFDEEMIRNEIFRNASLQEFYPAAKGDTHVYHAPVNIVKGNVDKVEQKQEAIKELPSNIVAPEKWYEKWFTISFIVGVLTFLITWWIVNDAKIGAVAGIIALGGFLLLNPKRWLKRLAIISLSAFIGTLYFNIQLGYEKKSEDGNFHIELSDPPAILSICLLVVTIVCIVAEVWKERK